MRVSSTVCLWLLWRVPERGARRCAGICGEPVTGWKLWYPGIIKDVRRAEWIPVCVHHEPAELILAA